MSIQTMFLWDPLLVTDMHFLISPFAYVLMPRRVLWVVQNSMGRFTFQCTCADDSGEEPIPTNEASQCKAPAMQPSTRLSDLHSHLICRCPQLCISKVRPTLMQGHQGDDTGQLLKNTCHPFDSDEHMSVIVGTMSTLPWLKGVHPSNKSGRICAFTPPFNGKITLSSNKVEDSLNQRFVVSFSSRMTATAMKATVCGVPFLCKQRCPMPRCSAGLFPNSAVFISLPANERGSVPEGHVSTILLYPLGSITSTFISLSKYRTNG